MVNFDFSPLYRSSVGFDHLVSMLDSARRIDQKQSSYPPYNIESIAEDQYRITMAVAGFSQEELDVEIENNLLTITGTKKPAEQTPQYLYQGIAARNFERRFQLADHVKVRNASLEHGLLQLELVREIPEAMKPRRIEIQSADYPTAALEGEKVA